MGSSTSSSTKDSIDLNFYEWKFVAESSSFYTSPVFTQEGESFVCFLNLNLSTLYIDCCSASLWQFDEIFPFGIDVIILEELISTKANMTKAKPFCAIILPLNNMKNYHSEEEEREKRGKYRRPKQNNAVFHRRKISFGVYKNGAHQ